MKLGVLSGRLTLVVSDTAVDVAKASDGRFDPSPHSAFGRWGELVDWSQGVGPSDENLNVGELECPVPAARQIFGVGANYGDHVAESGGEPPTAPLIFTKFSSCLAGPYSPIPLPTRRVDWEAELVVVIGQRAHRVAEAAAWGHVAGLTVGQDISERVLQLAGPHAQFSLGKSFPGFGPIGPYIVTQDEFEAPDDLAIECSVNGTIMQAGRTSDMIFGVPELIARLSAVCPLLPGDLIFTGTPAGVGAFKTPRVFLRPGDLLTTAIEGIGEIRNAVIAGPGYEPGETEGA